MDRETKIDTAYHEAAHAVFDYNNRLKIRHVYATDKRWECVSAWPVEPRWWEALELASGVFAGEMAVYRRRGRTDLAGWLNSFEEFEEDVLCSEWEDEVRDSVRAMELLRIAADAPDPGDLENCYGRSLEIARLRLGAWWPWIVAVAERLLEVGELEGAEVEEIIEATG